MKFKNLNYKKFLIRFFPLLAFIFLLLPGVCRAMPPGTLLYRTTDEGKMFGYSGDPLVESVAGVMTGINPGHVGIYIGQEEGIDYVVEALASGVVKTKLEYFVNESLGEEFLGAKIPKDLSPLRQAKAVALAKNLAEAKLNYDLNFKKQKGPSSGDWTCVGLVEKIYESSDISNPANLLALEYDNQNYAINITPDGYDDYSFYNKEGDCFSRDKEFSLIAPRTDLILPLPEKYGFNAGLIYQGDRYIFFPYSQFLQTTLEDVVVDRKISSEFSAKDVRGGVKASALLLRWSLINNPSSAIKIATENIKQGLSSIFNDLKTAVAYASGKIFSDSSNDSNLVLINNDEVKNDISKDALGQEKTGSTLSKIGAVTVATAKSSNEKAKIENNLVKESLKTEAKKELASNNNSETASTTNLEKVKASLSSLITVATQASSSSLQTSSSSLQAANTISQNSNESLREVEETPNLNIVKNEAPAETLKISKIYTTGDNDFIELYNPNNFAIDLLATNYRLEKAKTATDPGIMMRVGNEADGSYPGGTIISAKGYYLIVRHSATNYYLSRADAIATRTDFNLTGLNQSVYLGLGAISSYEDEDIVDVVGFGPEAIYYLGSAPAPKIEDYYFLNRFAYKNNNSLDYNLLLSSDPAAISAWEAENNAENNNENSTTTPPLADDDDDDLPPADDDDDVPPPSDDDDEITPPDDDDEIPPPDDDPLENNEASEFDLALKSVMIQKIGVFANDDYIELVNFSNYDIDLAAYNFRLEKTKTAFDPAIIMRIGDPLDGHYQRGTILEASSTYLIVREGASNRLLEIADAIATRIEFNLSGADYSILLGMGPISSGLDEDIVDLVGYGSKALYYLGAGPAQAIPDRYFLERTQMTNNNSSDFSLVYDYFYIDGELGNNPENLWETQSSEGLKYLWHFDDCYAAFPGQVIIGKWACGRKFGYHPGNFSGELIDGLDMDTFSIGFYHHNDYYWPRIDLSLTNSYGNSFAVSMEPGLVNVGGVIDGANIYTNTDFGDNWNYFTLVVNRPESYWALYSNGQEILRRNFLANLPDMNNFSLSGGTGSMSFDEIAIWDRALSQGEIAEILLRDLALGPRSLLKIPPAAELLYHWEFNEYAENFAYDKIDGELLATNEESWTSRSPDNHAILVSNNNPISVNFSKSLAYQDLSLAFWWRNSSHPEEGRARLSLFKNDLQESVTGKFGLTLDYNRQNYIFNGGEGVLAQGIMSLIPNDGAWHHLVLVYDSSQYKLKLFVDGEERLTKEQIPFELGTELIDSLKISSDSQTSAIDDLMIFKGVLKDSEIYEIYQETGLNIMP